ncbi:MAG: hypothetical protein EYC62_00325 [Alphaproteobacteria bacterium]|nr:MAG: hypothetical protein EYC62_00325 [Alphaproteobacteria bacterium]
MAEAQKTTRPYLSWEFIRSLATELEWDDFDISILYQMLRTLSYNKATAALKSASTTVTSRAHVIGAQLGFNPSLNGETRKRQFGQALQERYRQGYTVPWTFDAETFAPIVHAIGLTPFQCRILWILCHSGASSYPAIAKHLDVSSKTLTNNLYPLLLTLGLPPMSREDPSTIGELQATVRARLVELSEDYSAGKNIRPEPKMPREASKIWEELAAPFADAVMALGRSHHIDEATIKAWFAWINGVSVNHFISLWPDRDIALINSEFSRAGKKLCPETAGAQGKTLNIFRTRIQRDLDNGYFDPAVNSYAVLFFARLGLKWQDLQICWKTWNGKTAAEITEETGISIYRVRDVKINIAKKMEVAGVKNLNLAAVRHKVAAGYVEWRQSGDVVGIVEYTLALAQLHDCTSGGIAALALARPDLAPSGSSLRGLSEPAMRFCARVLPQYPIEDLLALNELKRGTKALELYQYIVRQYEQFDPRQRSLNSFARNLSIDSARATANISAPVRKHPGNTVSKIKQRQ